MDLPVIEDLRELFLQDIPLLDVRAPVEFNEGAFPSAINLPLIDDDERHVIGIRYKEQGQDAAIELGTELVSGELKDTRVAAWNNWIAQHPDGALYCFRGGKRSQISQRWIYEATGVALPRVKGGYKALRRFLLEELAQSIQSLSPIVLGGRTGSGKTLLLQQLGNRIDLERLAWHRGSAFGGHAQPQPSQIDFENALSIELLKHLHSTSKPIIFEDESRNIGSRHMPEALYDRLAQAPLIILEVSDEQRIVNSVNEYVHTALAEYQSLFGQDQGFNSWSEYLLNSLAKIQKRLGGERYKALKQIMQDAITEFQRTGDAAPHREWVKALLLDYYDPMYDYQITQKAKRIIFSGSPESIISYLNDQY